VGLKNIGNSKSMALTFLACYFNSLIQAYFYNPEFIKKLLEHENREGKVESSSIPRAQASIKLVKTVAELFQTMVLTNKKYIEPSKVLKALVDDFGNPIEFGEQKDVAEFNLNLLQRIQEGLGERPKKKENLNEEEKNELKSGRLERSSSILGDDIEVQNKELEQSLTVS